MTALQFDEIYAQVPVEQKRLLQEFRANHPYKELEVGGARWRYIACGQGDKTLLFLPGAFMRADMWFYPITAFEKKYRIITLDNYALQGTFAMDEVCRAHAAILGAKEAEKATVIGVSGGAGVAQFFLQEYPQKVEHVVFSHCSVAGVQDTSRLQKQLKLIKILPFPILMRILRLVRRSGWAFPSSSEWLAFRGTYLREMSLDINKEMFLRFMEAGVEAHRSFVFRSEALQHWPGEILVLSSKGDKSSIDHVGELKARYPRARTHIFEEGGHHTFMLFPKTYTAVLEAFLDEVLQQRLPR